MDGARLRSGLEKVIEMAQAVVHHARIQDAYFRYIRKHGHAPDHVVISAELWLCLIKEAEFFSNNIKSYALPAMLFGMSVEVLLDLEGEMFFVGMKKK